MILHQQKIAGLVFSIEKQGSIFIVSTGTCSFEFDDCCEAVCKYLAFIGDSRFANFESPSPTYPPKGIHPAALPFWKIVLRRYSDIIFNGQGSGMEWATAIGLLERSCKQRSIPVWNGDP